MKEGKYSTPISSSGAGGAGGPGFFGIRPPELFKLDAMLLEHNSGIGLIDGQQPWICLGVIEKIDPHRKLWVRRGP